jgi:branched-chain amino acid transport system ATP-binding protein
VLQGISLRIAEGEIVTLIGRNGAGKSTTLKSIMGLTPPKAGNIFFKGEDITGLATHLIAQKGIGFIPEDRRIFAGLRVYDNIRLAMVGAKARGNGRGSADFGELLDRIYRYFPILRQRAQQNAKSLSGGEQQMLAIARALISRPSLLLVDEPTQGLAPVLAREIGQILLRIRDDGVSILLVEQNAKLALSIAQRAYLIDQGVIQLEGSAAEIAANEEVQRQYLGV